MFTEKLYISWSESSICFNWSLLLLKVLLKAVKAIKTQKILNTSVQKCRTFLITNYQKQTYFHKKNSFMIFHRNGNSQKNFAMRTGWSGWKAREPPAIWTPSCSKFSTSNKSSTYVLVVIYYTKFLFNFNEDYILNVLLSDQKN